MDSMHAMTQRKSRRAFLRQASILGTGATFSGSLASSRVALAESPNGWGVVSAEIILSHQVPDGRTFTVGYANIVKPSKGRTGVLMSIYRPSRSPIRVALPADGLHELDPLAYHLRAWWNPLDWLDSAIKTLQGVVDALTTISAGLKQVLKGVCQLLSAFGIDICNGLNADLGGGQAGAQAVAIHLTAVREAALDMPIQATLAERLAYAHGRTIERLPVAQRRTAWYAISQAGLAQQ